MTSCQLSVDKDFGFLKDPFKFEEEFLFKIFRCKTEVFPVSSVSDIKIF